MRTYTLKPGDSLTKIAQRVYGSKDSVRVILRANKFPNPDNVPVGAVINLP
jgi:nucleoid-associated protein YgaU